MLQSWREGGTAYVPPGTQDESLFWLSVLPVLKYLDTLAHSINISQGGKKSLCSSVDCSEQREGLVCGSDGVTCTEISVNC